MCLSCNTGGVDYTPLVSVPLVFNSSQTQITVPIIINNDSLVEDDETFSAMISLAVATPRVTLNPNRAALTITDSDSKLKTICIQTLILDLPSLLVSRSCNYWFHQY